MKDTYTFGKCNICKKYLPLKNGKCMACNKKPEGDMPDFLRDIFKI